jgi:enoyl-CoA hydratase/carnithine racemase
LDTGLTTERRSTAAGDVCYFTIHARTSINVVGREVLEDCTAALGACCDDETLRCAVLQGCSERAFIGGADLNEIGALDHETALDFITTIHLFCEAIRMLPVPVVARIQGYCLGGGLEIAAACDLRVCDTSAKFGMPEVRIGVPSVIEAALLPQLIGWGKTRELLYRGNIIDAAEAARIGLVEHCVAPDRLDPLIEDIVGDIVGAGPKAIRLQKRLCHEWEGLTTDDAIEAGRRAFVSAYDSDEPARYVRKFFAGRKH